MAKYIAQLILTGSQVVGRAFVKALRQEYAASQEAAKRYAQNSGSTSHSNSTIDIKTGISLKESLQILDVSPELNVEEIEKKYNHLYNSNDKSKGGSVYIQAKSFWPLCRNLAAPRTPLVSSQASLCISSKSYHECFSPPNKELFINNIKELYIPPISPSKQLPDSAVLVPFCYHKGKSSILYTLRSSNLNKHRGEVSFPGGRKDETDLDLIETALRETQEELGINPSSVEVWTSIAPVLSRYHKVTPVFGFIGDFDSIQMKVNPTEVDSVFAYSLESLCTPSNWDEAHSASGFISPSFRGKPKDVWGLTAIITHFALLSLRPSIYSREYKMNYFIKK